MAVIRNKNSQVKEKLPDASALQYGELAVNCHTESPAVHFKDTDGKIVSLTPAVSANDGAINIDGGDGITAIGDNATANQAGDTTRTLAVDTTWLNTHINTNFPGAGGTAGDGAINVNGGDGITASGDNATANQTGDTTRTLAVDEAWLGTWLDTNYPIPPSPWTEDSGKLYPTTLTNNVQVGGTAAAPNISLNAGGSATFAGKLEVQDVTLESAFSYSIIKTDATGFWSPDNWYFGPDVSNPSSAVITLNATDGSGYFAGNVGIGTDYARSKFRYRHE